MVPGTTFIKALRRVVFALVIGVGAASPAFAQDGSVVGRVIDAETHEPLISATIELRDAVDSSLVAGAAADEQGRFSLTRLRTGRYVLRIGFVGFAAHVVPELTLTAEQPRVDVGTIALRPETAELDEVQISAEREFMEFGIDRTIYHPANQPVAMGGAASDLLEQIPSVEIDIDGNISLRGSQGVTVYLNGKPAPMRGEALTSFLRSLAAADIERVEVIPNPSARFEPEGGAGILNIVLKKERGIGLGGGVQASINTRGRYGASVNGHYGNGPVNAFANYGLRYGAWDSNGWRYRENRYLDPMTFLREEMESSSAGLSHNVNASVDYSLGEKSTLSFATVLSRRGNDGDSETSYLELDENEYPFERYRRLRENEDADLSMDYRLDFRHVFQPRVHELSIEMRYEDDREDESRLFTHRTLPLDDPTAPGMLSERQQITEWDHDRELEFDLDYQRPLTEWLKAEVGLDSDLEWSDNSFFSETALAGGEFVPDDRLNNTFTYSQRQHSAYAVLSAGAGAFGVQAGLRFEHATTLFDLHTTNEAFKNRYTSLFPSVHLTYKLSDRSQLQASYTKRVRRPRERQLNPYGGYGDPTSRREGNPYLTPEYTHSGELSYRLLGQSYTVTVSPYLRYSVDQIGWHERITDDGVTILTFDNFDTETSYGAELITSLSIRRWFKGEWSTNFYKQVTEAGSLAAELSNNAIGFRSRLSGTVDMGSGLKLQLAQRYRSPRDIPGGRINASTSTDIALRQEWMSGRLSVGLNARDIFGENGFLVARDMERYYQEYYQNRRERSVQLSIRYTFAGKQPAGGGSRGGTRGGRRR